MTRRTAAGGFATHAQYPHTVWTPFATGMTSDLCSIMQPAYTDVWMGGGSGAVLVNNLGTWYRRDSPDWTQDYTLFTDASGMLAAAGTAGSLYRTADFGFNWTLHYSSTVPLRDICGSVYGTAWVVGDEGTVLQTDWSSVTPLVSGTTADLRAITKGPGFMIAVGEGGAIIRSTDGGATWNPRPSGTTQTLRAVSYNCAVLAVGDAGTLLKSTDNGPTWCQLDAGTSVDLFTASVFDPSYYLVGGRGGLVLRTLTGGGACAATSVEPAAPAAGSWTLDGPYPNPLATRGEFRLRIANDETVRADVVDVRGRVISSLVDGRMSAGESRSLVSTTKRFIVAR